MLTVRDHESDRVRGFESGADDPVTKPFSLRELIGRIKVGLRRSRSSAPALRRIQFGDVDVDLAARRVRVRDYTNEPAADVARARLASARTERRQDLTPRRVLDGHWALMFDISRDGRFTIGPERRGYSAYDLVLRNVATGQITTLVPGSDGASGFQARISHDGRRVAYNWTAGGGNQLRVIETTPGASPLVITAPANSRMSPVDWSVDGTSLLVVLRRFNNSEYAQEISRELAWLSLDTGSLRTIKTVDPLQADFLTARLSPDFAPGSGQSGDFGIAVSPDGRTLAISAWIRANEEARIFTVDVTGANYREIVSSFATGWLADKTRWTRDGRGLVFVTFDASRDWRIMRVPIEGGQPEFDGLDHRAMAALIPDLRMAPGNFNNIELSPDGARIAASTWTLGKHELWTLDGLLSVLNSR